MNTIDNIRQDIMAFADDENNIVVDINGDILFSRLGSDISCKYTFEQGTSFITVEGNKVPYNKFISSHLARLDILAQKIVQKREVVEPFINAPAKLSKPSGDISGKALNLLSDIIQSPYPFATNLVFITADAGHGKTALLKQLQHQQAKNYLSGQVQSLFWHVDLQGRQLLRLNEALLGDLGDLRFTGLYMQSIVTLVKRGLLVIAIDGFDELAAEQGNDDALGALSQFVKLLDNSGTLIAASRRTFFDTEDYRKRSKIITGSVSTQCIFEEIRLGNWPAEDTKKYFSKIRVNENFFKYPDHVYDELFESLGQDSNHPMLTVPFLVSHVAKGILLYSVHPSEFIKSMENPYEGTSAIIEAFINREVTLKWKSRDTGEPYLTNTQHLELLTHIAEEMWLYQKEKIRFDFVEELLSALMEQWSIDHKVRQNTIEMVKMHVLLVPPENDYTYRKFDHPEFKNYFLALALKSIIDNLDSATSIDATTKFLSIGQLPDATAKYVAKIISKETETISKIILTLQSMVNNEWRPTYLQTNIGTILPYLINNVKFSSPTRFNAKVVYPSIVFEGTNITNFIFQNGHFLNTTFQNVTWDNVSFEECDFTDVKIDNNSTYENVSFLNCTFNSVIIISKEGDEISREYAPQKIRDILGDIGFEFPVEDIFPIDEFTKSTYRSDLIKLLETFRRTTSVSDLFIRAKFPRCEQKTVFETIIPLMIKYGLLRPRVWKGHGSGQSWTLSYPAAEIIMHQDMNDGTKLASFWKELRKKSFSKG